LPPYSWREFFDHQLRWVRNVRDLRGWGYLGAGITFGVPWALIGLAVAEGGWRAWSVFWFDAGDASAYGVDRGDAGVKDREALRHFWLIPLRDCVALLVWLGGFVGSTVVWRGNRFRLSQGKLKPV